MGVRLSTPRPARSRRPIGAWGLLCCGLAACAPPERDFDAPAPVQVSRAPLANDDCVGARPLALPGAVDSIVVERSSEEGWTAIQRIAPAGGQLLAGVAEGEAVLRFIACVDRTPQYATGAMTLDVAEASKAGLNLHFKPLDRLACTGTTQGPAYNRYAGLGRGRAFAAGARLEDGRVLVAGGADAVADGRMTGRKDGADWDLYVPGESLFLPGVDRAQPLDPRPMQAPRIAARAVPWQAPGAAVGGALVIGGAPSVQLGVEYATGPLVPGEAQLSRPAAEYFDPTSGTFTPLVTVDGAALTARFMPGVAADDAGRVIIAGGLEWPGDDAHPDGIPSDVIEIIDGDRLRTLALPRAAERAGGDDRNGLVGPSVTPIGGGRAFIWGGDLNGCGQRPGWLLNLDPTPTVTELAIVDDEAPPTCDAPGEICRAWYPTAFHSATLLGVTGDTARVLIVGGVAMRQSGPSNNPDPGVACEPNVFVAEIDAAAATVGIRPVGVDFEASGRLKRAFHTATPAGGGRILIAGGWAFENNANLFRSAADVLFYRDARPAGAIAPAPDTLTAPRLGALGVSLRGGGVLLAGGLVRDDAGFAISEAAEVYTAPIASPSCDEGG